MITTWACDEHLAPGLLRLQREGRRNECTVRECFPGDHAEAP
jgi:hypothetical protein